MFAQGWNLAFLTQSNDLLRHSSLTMSKVVYAYSFVRLIVVVLDFDWEARLQNVSTRILTCDCRIGSWSRNALSENA